MVWLVTAQQLFWNVLDHKTVSLMSNSFNEVFPWTPLSTASSTLSCSVQMSNIWSEWLGRSLPCTQCSADYVTMLCTSFPKKANCITTVMESECHLKMNLAEDLVSWTSFKNRTNKVAPLLIFYFTGSIAFHSVAIKHKTISSVDAWVSHSLLFLHKIFILTCMYNTRTKLFVTKHWPPWSTRIFQGNYYLWKSDVLYNMSLNT